MMTTADDTTAAVVGERSSVAAALCTLLFALAMILGGESPYISYAVCMLLPIAYVLACLANAHVVKNSETAVASKQIFADAASLFAVVYCVCECIVYYVQLTFVRLGNPSSEVLTVVRYVPPSAFFSINILGYSFLALSTFFMGFSVSGDEGPLRIFLLIHGVWGLIGLLAPALPFVYEDSDLEEGSYWKYTAGLLAWCLMFTSTCMLLALRFRRLTGEGNENNSRKKLKP